MKMLILIHPCVLQTCITLFFNSDGGHKRWTEMSFIIFGRSPLLYESACSRGVCDAKFLCRCSLVLLSVYCGCYQLQKVIVVCSLSDSHSNLLLLCGVLPVLVKTWNKMQLNVILLRIYVHIQTAAALKPIILTFIIIIPGKSDGGRQDEMF